MVVSLQSRHAMFATLFAAAVGCAGVGCAGDRSHAATNADSGWDGGRVCAMCGDTRPLRMDDMDAGEADGSTDGLCTDCGACEQKVAVGNPVHVEGHIDYPDPPPAGGPHNPCWAAWGAHADEVPTERWVHNVEHGGVVFLYWCPDGCAADVTELGDFADTHERVLLTPYPGLQTHFAFISWSYRLLTDCYDFAAARAFYDAHIGRGLEPVAADPPASCL